MQRVSRVHQRQPIHVHTRHAATWPERVEEPMKPSRRGHWYKVEATHFGFEADQSSKTQGPGCNPPTRSAPMGWRSRCPSALVPAPGCSPVKTLQSVSLMPMLPLQSQVNVKCSLLFRLVRPNICSSLHGAMYRAAVAKPTTGLSADRVRTNCPFMTLAKIFIVT